MVVQHCLGKYRLGGTDVGLPDIDWLQELKKLKLIRPPVKLAAEHFCLENRSLGTRAVEAGVRLFVEPKMRHNMRFHYGDTETVLFELQTFGIPTDDFPTNEEGTIELGFHKQWMQARRLYDEQQAKGESPKDSIILPRRFDVLFGKRHENRAHTGNLRAVHLVEMHFEKYEQAPKNQKTAIAEQVMNIIFESHGRFLLWKDGVWEEADFETAREKISHYFRHQRTKQKNALIKAADTKSAVTPPAETCSSNKRAATVSPGPPLKSLDSGIQ